MALLVLSDGSANLLLSDGVTELELSASVTVAAVVDIPVRCPYLSTDTLGTKQYRVFQLVAGVAVPIGNLVTSGFTAIPNITNGWEAVVSVVPNGSVGDFAGYAVFENVSGASRAVELFYAPTSTPSAVIKCKIAPFSPLDIIGTPGYQIYDKDNAAVGSHVTSGIPFISGTHNQYAARISMTPGFKGTLLWDH